MLRFRKRTVKFWQKRRKENAVERGDEGARKSLNASETNSQVGVTRCGGTFTDPVAQICHPYDRTPLECETMVIELVVCEGSAVTSAGVEPPFERACAAGRVMYCVEPRHDRRGNVLRMASSCH